MEDDRHRHPCMRGGHWVRYAKLPQPPMDDAAKAKAKEAKNKDIDAAKKDAEQLAQAQDRIAERYKRK